MHRPAANSPRRGRRVISATVIGGVAAAVSLAGAPSAFAANDYLQFSVDGQTYSSSISGPIFEQALGYVPGGSSAATLWVRNTSGEPASLSSAAVIVRSAPELTGHIGLQAGLNSSLSTRSALGSQGSCTDLEQVWEIDSAEELQLNFVVDLSADAPNETMNKDAQFDVVFVLEPKAAETAPRAACSVVAAPGTTLPAEAVPGSASPTLPGTGSQAARIVTVPGTGSQSARIATDPGSRSPVTPEIGIQAATQQASVSGAGGYPKETTPVTQEPQAGIVAAGFHSTVEPIIRSLSGTLLIVMSVVFSAAVILRLRNRQA